MVKSKLYDNTLYIGLSGDLDEHNAVQARKDIDKLLQKENYRQIIIDLSELNFMDSTGIGVLIGRYKLVKDKGVSIFISSPNRQVDKIFSMTGIYNIMPKIV